MDKLPEATKGVCKHCRSMQLFVPVYKKYLYGEEEVS